MGSKVLGYVREKASGNTVPFVEKDENGFLIMTKSVIGWVSKNNFDEVDGPEDNGSVIKGVGKDSETIVNEHGGKQSKVLYRFDLCDPKAMFEMTKVLKEGFDKYGADENWRRISVAEHLNHLLIHAYAYLAGDKSDEHLSHIMCRAMFAQAVDLERVSE